MPTTPDFGGARESSAGDDFHVLWATRRVLGLLDDESSLETVVMEDLTPEDADAANASELLAVDLSQYYGGPDFASASRVLVSQLKYSQRNPTRTWTAARLSTPTNQGRPSVIRRLSQLYKAFADRSGRDELLAKLEIELVSNQPIGPRLEAALRASSEVLAGHPGQLTLARLIRLAGSQHGEDLKRLHDDTVLGSKRFTDFLRTLRLSVGQLPRAEQEIAITQGLSAHVKRELAHYSRAVYDMVRRRGLPEGSRLPIYLEDVLAALDVHGIEALLPCPPRFNPPTPLIPTSEPARLAAEVRQRQGQVVLAHGNAGIGKTTSVLQITEQLPAGSVVIAFDCFAGGDYLKPAHARHDPKRALLHLSNELAAKCRLPLLAVAPASPHDLWREFEDRLAAAAAAMGEEGAWLVVVIDAVDNAAWAAKREGVRSFVEDLWTIEVPDGAAVIATARTNRRALVGVPEDVTQIELEGFDVSASSKHLRSRFPGASDEEGASFHSKSQGNPRVQFYVLDPNRDGSPADARTAVDEAKRTPDNIFEELWSSAVQQTDDPAWAEERLADLLCLTAPITLERLTEVAAGELDRIEAFCRALVPGLRVESGSIAFQDEDFEKYLQDRLSAQELRAAHSRLADIFAAKATDDEYAAMVVAPHLFEAGRKQELLALAVEGERPTAIDDPLARLQVFRRRLSLALASIEGEAPTLETAQLLALAAEAANSDFAVAETIRKRPALALRYGDPAAVGAVWRDADNVEWHGPVHMHLASARARDGDEAAARQELRSVGAWLRRRYENDNRWDIGSDDLGAALEATYWLDGWRAAIRRLEGWRPTSFRYEVGVALIRRIARGGDRERIAAAVLDETLPAQLKARMLVALDDGTVPIDEARLVALAERHAATRTTSAIKEQNWPADFAELVARRTGQEPLINSLVTRFMPALPSWAPSRWEGPGHYRLQLRWRSLDAAIQGRTLDIDDLMPTSVTDDSDQRRRDVDSEKAAMGRIVEPLIQIYQRRAKAHLKRPRSSDLTTVLTKEIGRAAASDWEDHATTRYVNWIEPFCDVLILARGTNRTLLGTAVEAASALGAVAYLQVWPQMARPLIEDRRYREDGLELLKRAAAESEGREQPARELSEQLLELAAVADPWNSYVAADLYTRAVEAAEGLDDEGSVVLDVHARVARTLSGNDRAPAVAARMSSAVAAYAPRVSDERYLPWSETVAAATEMHPPSGFGLAARWEDERRLRISASLGPLLHAACEAGFVEARTAMALAGLQGEERGFTYLQAPLLDALRDQADSSTVAEELAHLSRICRRDLHGHARSSSAKFLIDWANLNGFRDVDAIAALEPYLERIAEGGDETHPHRRVRVAASPTEGDLGRADASTLRKTLDDLGDSLPGREDVSRFFRKAAEGRPAANRIEVLEAVEELPVKHSLMYFHTEDVLDGLAELLPSWSTNPAVRKWCEKSLRGFLTAQLPNLTRYREEMDVRMRSLERLVGRADAARIAIESAATHIDSLSPAALYTLAGQVASGRGREGDSVPHLVSRSTRNTRA